MPKSTARSFRHRKTARTAIVFLHGFLGGAETTWGRFPSFLANEPRLKKWDIWSIGFSTSLCPEVRGLWVADPGIALIARGLRTHCVAGSLAQYQRISIVAHSMGGLVAQRAIVDFQKLVARFDSLFLFGVPNLGLLKARIFGFFKLQFRDMTPTSEFIVNLRRRWLRLFPDNSEPFAIFTATGQRDQFVGKESSEGHFPLEHRHCVDGDHYSMVKPSASSDMSVRLVVSGLCRDPLGTNVWSSDQAAIERGEFRSAIKHMLPRTSELTNDALVDLALALDATGRRPEAIKVLEGRKQLSTAALGTLAGRYKRLWLFDGTASDVERSYDLYSRALIASEAGADHAQLFYHSINLAFLELAHFKRRGACKIFAQKALDACESAELKDFWNFATQGEAWLYLSNLNRAVKAYRAALRLGLKPRQIDSAYTQAMLAAERSLGMRPTTLSRVFEQAGG